MTDVSVPILIGAGLTVSAVLSKLGIESLLVSTQSTTSILPMAHVLNQRAMESQASNPRAALASTLSRTLGLA